MIIEIITIIFIGIILFLLCNSISYMLIAVTLIYLIIEQLIKNHSWINLGFNSRSLPTDISKTWFLILLVGIILPCIMFFIGKYMLSGFLELILSRLPLNINQITSTLINIIIGTFIEEIIYRGFMQQELTNFIGTLFAIIITSIIFAAVDFSKGSSIIVFF